MAFLITVGFGAVFGPFCRMAAPLKWCIVLCYNSFGAWRSSVARLLWERTAETSLFTILQ